MSPTPAELYAAWAQPESPWSAWAKPVLFASTLFSPSPETLPELPRVDGVPRNRDTAVIADLPGAESVLVGLALAQHGYQPVPLYNCSGAAGMVVDVMPIARLLQVGAVLLGRLPRRAGAPPAFLLDAERMANPAGSIAPGRYDNRWCVVPQDMPSASRLQAAGIRQVVLIADRVRDDLAHVLHRYAEAGLVLRQCRDPGALPAAVEVPRPQHYKSLWYRLWVFAGLRRNSAGGFGAIVPDPSSAGG
ncbi:MAG TPA: hypothetical protein VM074_01850 [Solimonas sp.]|nr:hypothetical protein [Solimonas sp.]